MDAFPSSGRLSVVDMCPADSESWLAEAQLLLWRVGMWLTFVIVLLAAFGVAVTLEHVLVQVLAQLRTLRGEGR